MGGAPFAIREWNISFGMGVGCVNLQMAHSLNRFYDSGDVTTYNAASSGDAWLLIGASAADSVIASSTGLNVAFFRHFRQQKNAEMQDVLDILRLDVVQDLCILIHMSDCMKQNLLWWIQQEFGNCLEQCAFFGMCFSG